MRTSTALALNQLNASFYRREAEPFSATRQVSWPGWDRCLKAVESLGPLDVRAVDTGAMATSEAAVREPQAPRPLRVLDVACGNLRYARFLGLRMPGCEVSYCGVDNNRQLAEGLVVPAGWDFRFEEKDIVGDLLGIGSRGEGASVPGEGVAAPGEGAAGGMLRGVSYGSGSADLTVCFGFLHHVPTSEARAQLLDELLATVRPGGVCCVSFWRFMSDPKLAEKARRTTAEGLERLGLVPGDLDEGDYLVGWQNQPGVYRYCHSFTDEEVDVLLGGLGSRVELLDRFRSDGRTGSLNEYLVLQKWHKTPPEQVCHLAQNSGGASVPRYSSSAR